MSIWILKRFACNQMSFYTCYNYTKVIFFWSATHIIFLVPLQNDSWERRPSLAWRLESLVLSLRWKLNISMQFNISVVRAINESIHPDVVAVVIVIGSDIIAPGRGDNSSATSLTSRTLFQHLETFLQPVQPLLAHLLLFFKRLNRVFLLFLFFN